MKGLEVLKKFKTGESGWLPLIDYAYSVIPPKNEYGEVNIGWNAGILENKRLFFSVCWATDGITMLTMYLSAKGIEDYTGPQIEKLFVDLGYYKPKPGHECNSSGGLLKFSDKNGNKFFSFNVVVGVEDEPAEIEGGNIYSLSLLNEHNSGNKEE